MKMLITIKENLSLISNSCPPVTAHPRTSSNKYLLTKASSSTGKRMDMQKYVSDY